jgi:HAD superfamily hydrolase (TIGR01509 family)
VRTLVLDAMGVIYSVGNDNSDLLCPFVLEKGGTRDIPMILMLYHAASLGEISSAALWQAVGLDPQLEDEYLQLYQLTDGLSNFLETASSQGYDVWCLSNDISEWSKKLRARFGLERYIRDFVVSGDVGVRKPERPIFDHLIHRMAVDPRETVFVDDQPNNLDAAAALGFRTILFSPGGHDLTDQKHAVATTFTDVLRWLAHR